MFRHESLPQGVKGHTSPANIIQYKEYDVGEVYHGEECPQTHAIRKPHQRNKTSLIKVHQKKHLHHKTSKHLERYNTFDESSLYNIST